MSKIAASGMPITPEGELSAAAAAARANPLDDAAFGAAVAAMRAQLEAWAGRAGGSTFAAPATTAPAGPAAAAGSAASSAASSANAGSAPAGLAPAGGSTFAAPATTAPAGPAAAAGSAASSAASSANAGSAPAGLAPAGGSALPPLDRSTLLALDIDGTILDINGEVPPRTRAAVVAAAQVGVQVVLATGRGIEAALPVADFLGLTRGWMVCANGALTVRLDPKLKGTASLPGGYEITNSVTFDPTTAIGRLHQVLPEAIFAVEMPGRGFLTSADFPPGELIENTTTVSLEQLSSQPVSRVIVRAPGMALADFEVAVRSAGLHAVEYAIGWTAWLDVNAAGVSKASALDALVSGLGVKHTVAMGDGANDLEMLRWADLSVAMGSAPARVKNATSVVTEPVWHEGAAIVLAALSR